MGDSTYLDKKGNLRRYKHKQKSKELMVIPDDKKKEEKEDNSSHKQTWDEELEGIIGKKGEGFKNGDTIEDALLEVNPNYRKGREFQINCQRCAPTYELRRRGYDVEALANDGYYPSFMSVFDFDPKNYSNYVMSTRGNLVHFGGDDYDKLYNFELDNPNRMGRGASGATDSIINAMTKWGNGSRATLTVAWQGGGAHIMNVENVGGEIWIVDGQVNQTVKGRDAIERYMSRTRASGSILARVDNLPINKNLSDLKRTSKRRERK